jgi:hypothetical protein
MDTSHIIVGREKKSVSFFAIIAMVGLLAVLIGFGGTFILPSAKGTFLAPPIIYIHGAFAFSWILLFVIQTLLIHNRKYAIHQKLGVLAVMAGVGVMVTMILVGHYVVGRDLQQGFGESAYSSLIGNITSAVMFFSFVVLGVVNRRNAASHKRLMLLATVVVLWPAWYRFRHYFPSVPKPEIWFALVLADSLIIVAWIWDKLKNGRIHPVLLFGGLFIILEQSFEVMSYDNAAWRNVAKWVYKLF